MNIALTIVGIVLILEAVRDVFHTLFNPSIGSSIHDSCSGPMQRRVGICF